MWIFQGRIRNFEIPMVTQILFTWAFQQCLINQPNRTKSLGCREGCQRFWCLLILYFDIVCLLSLHFLNSSIRSIGISSASAPIRLERWLLRDVVCRRLLFLRRHERVFHHRCCRPFPQAERGETWDLCANSFFSRFGPRLFANDGFRQKSPGHWLFSSDKVLIGQGWT